MRYDRAIIFILTISFICSSLVINQKPIQAEDGDNKQNSIDTIFKITVESPTYFAINATTDVKYLTMPGSGIKYNSSQIESGNAPFDAIRGRIHEVINLTIRNTFPGSKIVTDQALPNYTNDSFYSDFFVTLTTDFFGMNKKSDLSKMLNGMLNMGAVIVYDFDLYADDGWRNIFRFYSDSEYTIISSSNEETVDGGIENQKEKKIKITNMSESPGLKEEISFNFNINSTKNKDNSLEIVMAIKTMAISIYNIPDYVEELSFIPADGIRLFVENNFNNITWSNIKSNTVDPIIQNVSSIIENSTFNQTLNLLFEWDTNTTDISSSYNLNNMNANPPIKASFTDNFINLSICNITDRAFYGLINTGGKVNLSLKDINFGDNLNKLSYEHNISLFFPKNMTLNEQNPFSWKQPEDIEGAFESKDAKEYNKEKEETVIEIDLQNPRLNVLSFITGDTKLEFDAVIKESRKYYVSDISNQSEYFPIPEKISLDYLCADAFRLCVEENVFSSENMSSFLQNEKNIFKQRTTGLWHSLNIDKEARVDKKAFESSLNAEETDIFNMNEYPAITVNSDAEIVKPIRFDLGFLPPKFDLEQQSFNIKSIEGHNVTYRIIFPDGIDVKVKNSLDKKVSVTKTEDGRKIVEISFNSSEQNLSDLVYCELEASGFFVLGMFLPCILTFIVAIILVIVIIFVRKKKHGGLGFGSFIRRKLRRKKDEGGESYEEEEFYVPPPPESK